jgi:phage shock protein PspC (stress-responsive transcriptional regulator)
MNDISSKKLERKRDGRMLAGVCVGVADYFGVDVNVVRLVFAISSILWGLGALVYLIAWVVLPEQGEPESIVERLVNKGKQD